MGEGTGHILRVKDERSNNDVYGSIYNVYRKEQGSDDVTFRGFMTPNKWYKVPNQEAAKDL
jgi:alpha-amylase/alpha-mannosidase (GH57 family)